MSPIPGPDIDPGVGEFGQNQIDDPVRCLRVVNADTNNSGFICASSAQNVTPQAVAEVNPESETGGLPDALCIGVDNGRFDITNIWSGCFLRTRI